MTCFNLSIFTAFWAVLLIETGSNVAFAGKAAARKRDWPSPVFLQTPLSHYYVSRSQPVTLVCAAENVCDVQIKCDGEKFQDGGTRVCGKKRKGCKKRQEKIRLNYNDFPKGTRSRTCRCKAWGTIARTSNKTVIEKTILRRTFGSVQPIRVALTNSSVILQCKPPSGSPKPNITWIKNGQPIPPRDLGKRMRINTKKDLVIKRTAENDSGEYWCIAENIAARREGPVMILYIRENISVPICQESRSPCANWSSCIYRKWICDGNSDCNDGSDEQSCEPKSHMLVVGTLDGLFTVPLHNTSRARKIKAETPVAVDFGIDSAIIYWSDTKRINRFSVHNGVNEDELFRQDNVRSIEGLAVDWVGAKLYWVDSKDNSISMGDLRNGRKVTIVNEDLDAPRAIVVSPSEGYIYWTDWGRHPKIERARLDGTERKFLVTSGVQFPNGLAFDETEKMLYWTDAKYGTIEAVTWDGMNRTVIFNGSALYHPFGLDVYQDFIYWTDWKMNAVLQIHKSGRGGVKEIFAGINQPMGIKILHRRKEPKGLDPCQVNNGGCDFLCLYLPSARKQKCFCGHSFELGKDTKICERIKDPGEGEGKSLEAISRTEPSLVVILLIVILVLGVAGFFIYLIKHRFSPRSSELARMLPEENQEAHELSLVTDETESASAGSQVAESPNWAGEGSVVPSNRGHDVETSDKAAGIVVFMTKVDVVQNGGVTVVGDEAKVHHHYSPDRESLE